MGDAMSTAIAENTGDVITIIRDPVHKLGKQFSKAGKKSAVSVSVGIAVQRHVPTAAALADVIREVSEDPHAALINSGFKDIPVGEEFLILSEREIAKRLKLKTRKEQLGVHTVEYEGRTMKAVGRFKENTTPSRWVLHDRDVDDQTPAQFGAEMDFVKWCGGVEKLLPGVEKAPMVITGSSSSRVLKDGTPFGQGNGHVWVQIADAQDAERLRVALMVRAAELGMTWIKFNKHGKSGRLTTIIDPSVFIRGRLVFCGKPTAIDGMEVIAQTVDVGEGTVPLDTSTIVLPEPDKVRELTRKAGAEMSVRRGGDGTLAVDAYDLTLGTVIELEDGTFLPVADAAQRLAKPGDKLRCQTPFRASESVAAFLSKGGDGKLFIYDVGDGTTHWQSNDDYCLNLFTDLDAADRAVWEAARRHIEGVLLVGDDAERAVAEIKDHIAAANYAQEETRNVIARIAQALEKPEEEIRQSLGAAGRPKFASVPLSEMLATKHPEWFIKGVLPKGELGVLFGESGSGKSFMAFDMMMCVAREVPWRGHKVRESRVTYICAEGKAGLSTRLQAYARHHQVDLTGVPFKAITDVPDFLKDVDDVALAKQINAEGGADLIIVDTLAQTIPGASENSSDDMSKALFHCRRLAANTGAMVLLIHHAGKDLSRGARGWSGMKAAADVELCVERHDDARVLTVTKLKDGGDYAQFPFKLLVVPLGIDDDGEVFSSCVIEHSNEAVVAEKKGAGTSQRA
ncbi:MAG: AAA family ATPase, partial [Gallionella sp.]